MEAITLLVHVHEGHSVLPSEWRHASEVTDVYQRWVDRAGHNPTAFRALLMFVDGPGAGLPVTTLLGWLSAAVSDMQDRERFWREHDAGAATASTLAKLWERGTAEIRRNGDTAAQLVRLLEELGRAGVPLAVRLREEV